MADQLTQQQQEEEEQMSDSEVDRSMPQGRKLSAREVLERMAGNIPLGRCPGHGMRLDGAPVPAWITVEGVVNHCEAGRITEEPAPLVVAGVEVPGVVQPACERSVPGHGRDYWYVNSAGKVDMSIWRGDEIHFARLRHGNVFKDREQARIRARVQHLVFAPDAVEGEVSDG